MSISTSFLERWRAEREQQRRRQQSAAQQLDRIRGEREQERQRQTRQAELRTKLRDELLFRMQVEKERLARDEELQRSSRERTLLAFAEVKRERTARSQRQEALRASATENAQPRQPVAQPPRAPRPTSKPKAARKTPVIAQLRARTGTEPLAQRSKREPRRERSHGEPSRKAVPHSPKENNQTFRQRSEESARQKKLQARTNELERRSDFRLGRPELSLPGKTLKRATLRSLAPAPLPPTRSATGTTLPTTTTQEDPTRNWLSTQNSFIVDENGIAVYLRGVTVAGLDTVAPTSKQTVAQALALDQSGFSALADGWGVNLIRIPLLADSILSGTSTLGSSELLSGLDDLIDQADQAGCYVLLALKPSPDRDGILPSDHDYLCMQKLAIHYRDQPAVLYEPFASTSTLAKNWPGIALAVIGTIRREHPASLLFLGNGAGTADVNHFPLTFGTGDPIENLVYTIRLTPQVMNTVDRPTLLTLSHNYPVFVSEWSDGGPDFGRSSALAADLIERIGAGWAAAAWNTEPRLVVDASAHRYSATRWGSQVQRAMAQPVKLLLTSYQSGMDAMQV